MQQYVDLLRDVMANGNLKADRTGTGTLSVFQRQMRFNLLEGFPLVTVKHTPIRPIIRENLWFLNGDTNNETLRAQNVKIWDDWALGIEDIKWEHVQINKLKSLVPPRLLDTTVHPKPTEALKWVCSDLVGGDVNYVLKGGLRIGDLGPIYGKQMRRWNGGFIERRQLDEKIKHAEFDGKIDVSRLNQLLDYSDAARDQIAELLYMLKYRPDSRRHIVSNWNASELPDEINLDPQENVLVGNAALAWCHTMLQAYTRELSYAERKEAYARRFVEIPAVWNEPANCEQLFNKVGIPTRALSLAVYCRSQDLPLGTPFNIAGYALLCHMFAHILNYEVDELIWTGGDCHIYKNQLPMVAEFIDREPRPLPKLTINTNGRTVTDPKDFHFEDFILSGYDPHPRVEIPVSK